METGFSPLELTAGAALTTLVGLVVVAVWKGSAKLLAALVELAKLPAVVTDLVERLDRLAGLAARVDNLEAHMSLSTTTEGNTR